MSVTNTFYTFFEVFKVGSCVPGTNFDNLFGYFFLNLDLNAKILPVICSTLCYTIVSISVNLPGASLECNCQFIELYPKNVGKGISYFLSES